MLWVSITLAAVGLFWLGYRRPYRRRWLLPRQIRPQAKTAGAVDRQHRHLLAGGRLGESAVSAIASRYRELLRTGRVAELDREFQPGLAFALQVRALVAVGTTEAGRFLERLLTRSIARDPIEQTWYWADVAAGLRHLRHVPALPAVLRCTETADGVPAATVLAAEAVAFPNFASSLNDLHSPVGRAALRALATVCRGCREGTIDPGCMLRAGFGELLVGLSESASPHPNPWLTLVILETERLSRRCAHWGALLSGESAAIAEHLGRKLGETAATREQWLADARQQLPARFAAAPIEEQTAILRVAYELRLDVTKLFPHLPDLHHAWWTEAIQCFTWSRSPSAGPVLAWQANRWLGSRRYRRRVPVILAALRGHPCREAETVLLQAIVGTTAEIRRAAAGSLGWWAPLDPVSVIGALRQARTDPDERTRRVASAALARLGERASLNEHQEELHTEDSAVRLAAINRIAAEEISWLWPEVQALTENDDLETALAATEACEQFRESILGTKR